MTRVWTEARGYVPRMTNAPDPVVPPTDPDPAPPLLPDDPDNPDDPNA